jgi:branched-chain amino acid transport system substrate-binding protein
MEVQRKKTITRLSSANEPIRSDEIGGDMKKPFEIVIALAVVFGLVFSACTPAPTQPPAAATQAPAAATEAPAAATEAPAAPAAPSGDPILFASSLPLTGSFSIPGSKHQDGYQLCVDLINERGGLLGRPVELIVSDNQSDAEVAISQFERFINVDRVDIILGSFSSLITFPATSITEQAQYVHPIPSAAALRIYARGYEYLFYFQPNVAEYIGDTPMAMLRDLVGEDLPQTAALVYADDFFANAIAAGLTGGEVEVEGLNEPVSLAPGGFEEAGIEVVYTEQWPEQGFSDWITLANSVKASNAEMLFAGLTSPDEGIQLIRALQTVDYQPKYVFMSQGAQREFEEQLGEAAEGVTVHASWHPLANFSGVLGGEEFTNQNFLDAFQAKYSRTADEDEAIPFALCQGMEQAIRATESTDNTVLRDWLAARTAEDPVRTILGDFYWDERGLPVEKPFIMVQWQGGDLKFVYPQDAFPGVEELVFPKPEW